MRIGLLSSLTLVISIFSGPCLSASGVAGHSARKVIELHVSVDGDNLAFVPSHLKCVTGARVRLTFEHSGQILDEPHDWVLLKPGSLEKFVADTDRQADESTLPDHELIIASTPLCKKGKSVLVEFVAPKPGVYPFVCSVPGHGESMHGTLVVTSK